MKISENTAALVTGGASGLGLAVVEKFVSLGAKVAVFDMNEEEGSKVVSQHGVTFEKVSHESDHLRVRVSLLKKRLSLQ